MMACAAFGISLLRAGVAVVFLAGLPGVSA